MKKQTVFFDLGNVLLFFSHEKMWTQLADLTKISPNLLRQKFAQKGVFQAYETGQLDTEHIYRTLQALSNRSFSLLEAMRAASDIFTPNTELWPLVETLKTQGTRLVLLSNTNECHFNYAYSHYPILKLFDDYILSYQVKACKPQPEIFRKALNMAHGKSFYTDDIEKFVQAAKTSGLDGETFTDVPTLKEHLKARNFL